MAKFADYDREKALLLPIMVNTDEHKVVDLLNKDSSFFSFDEFLKIIKVKTKHLEDFKAISALRQYKKSTD